MGNVIVAIVVLVVGFMLVTYGVYNNVDASRRTQAAMSIGSTLERHAKHIQDLIQENGHVPLSSGEESGTGYGYYDGRMFDRDSTANVTYYPTQTLEGYFVCARSSDVSLTMQEAMQMVARDRRGAFVSGSCGTAAAAISNFVAVSLKVN